MGLFDVFKSEPLKLSPKLALAVGLLYMMAADGEIESEEIGQLQSVVGGDQELINTAVKYLRSVKYEQFLADAAALLNERQKLCLLINMADSLLSDGRAEQSEQQAFGKALSQFGMTEDGFKGYFETLAIKNNRAIWACPRFCVNGLMAGNCQSSQRKRNDRKQRTDRPPVGGLQKT